MGEQLVWVEAGYLEKSYFESVSTSGCALGPDCRAETEYPAIAGALFRGPANSGPFTQLKTAPGGAAVKYLLYNKGSVAAL